MCYNVRPVAKGAVDANPIHIDLSKLARIGNVPLEESRPIFVATPVAVVDKMLEAAKVEQNSVVVDLGSGDGRIVIAAARKYGCRAIGYEIAPSLVEESRAAIEEAKLGELVSIRNQNMFTADLSEVEVVTVYLNPSALERLKPQFARMRPGSRIVSHAFEIPGVEPQTRLIADSVEGQEHEVLVYVTPLTEKNNQSP